MLGVLGALKKKQPQEETETIAYTSSRICCKQQDDTNNRLISFGSNVYGRLGILDEHRNELNCGLVHVPRLIGAKFKVGEVACGAAHLLCCW